MNVFSDDSSNSHSNTVNIREKGGRRRRQKEEEEGEWRIFLCFKSYLNFGTYKLTHPKAVSHHVLHNCKVSRKFIDTISLRVQVWQKISLISRYFLYLNFGTRNSVKSSILSCKVSRISIFYPHNFFQSAHLKFLK